MNLMHSLFFLKATSSKGKDNREDMSSQRRCWSLHVFLGGRTDGSTLPSRGPRAQAVTATCTVTLPRAQDLTPDVPGPGQLRARTAICRGPQGRWVPVHSPTRFITDTWKHSPEWGNHRRNPHAPSHSFSAADHGQAGPNSAATLSLAGSSKRVPDATSCPMSPWEALIRHLFSTRPHAMTAPNETSEAPVSPRGRVRAAPLAALTLLQTPSVHRTWP